MGPNSWHSYAAGFAEHNLSRLQFKFGKAKKVTASNSGTRTPGQTSSKTAAQAPSRPAPLPKAEKPMTEPEQHAWAQSMGNRLARKHAKTDQAHHDYMMGRSEEVLGRVRAENDAAYRGPAGDAMRAFDEHMSGVRSKIDNFKPDDFSSRANVTHQDTHGQQFGGAQGLKDRARAKMAGRAESNVDPHNHEGRINAVHEGLTSSVRKEKGLNLFPSAAPSAKPSRPPKNLHQGDWGGVHPKQAPVDLSTPEPPKSTPATPAPPKTTAAKRTTASKTPEPSTAMPSVPTPAPSKPAAPKRAAGRKAAPGAGQGALFGEGTASAKPSTPAPAKSTPAPTTAAPRKTAAPKAAAPAAPKPTATVQKAPAKTATPTPSPVKTASSVHTGPAPTRGARPASAGSLPQHLQSAVDSAHHDLGGKVLTSPAAMHELHRRGLAKAETRAGSSGRVQTYHTLTDAGHAAATPRPKKSRKAAEPSE